MLQELLNINKKMNAILVYVVIIFTLFSGSLLSQIYPYNSSQGLKFWIKQDVGITSTSSMVNTWSEQSGAAITGNMIQSMSTYQPILVNGINYHEYVRFDGVNDYMPSVNSFTGLSLFNNDSNSILFVKNFKSGVVDFKWQTANSGSYRVGGELKGGIYYRFDFGDDATGKNDVSTRIINNQDIIQNLTTSSTTSTIYCNGVLDASKTITGANLTSVGSITQPLYIGANNAGSLFANVDIAECMIINRLLNTTERSMVESYLALKYGFTLGSSSSPLNYISSNNTLVWNGLSPYHNQVIGIGRDNSATGSSLYQKQSKTSDDTCGLYMGSLVALNKNNTSSITNDRSFVIIGSDKRKLCSTSSSLAEKPSGCGLYSRIEREWKVQNTNFIDNFSFWVKLNLCAQPNSINVNHLRLLVDDDGNFSNGGTTCYSSGTAGITISYTAPMITISGLSTSIIPQNSIRFITIGSINAGTPLPVDLTNFQLDCIEKGVEIKWETATEINNHHYTLYRSLDAIHWDSITRIEGAGNSYDIKKYQFKDFIYENSTLYYKLRQTDDEGRYEEFPAKGIQCSYNRKSDCYTRFYPNPMTECIFIEGCPSKLEKAEWVNSEGRIVQRLTNPLENEICLDSKTPSGVYILKLYYVNSDMKYIKITKK